MDDESLRTFQAIGVVDQVLPHTTPNQWLRFMNSRGRCFASIEPVRAVRVAAAHAFSAARRSGAACRRRSLRRRRRSLGHECTAVEADSSGVTIRLQTPDGAPLSPVRVGYPSAPRRPEHGRKAMECRGTAIEPDPMARVDLENDRSARRRIRVCNWAGPNVSIASPWPAPVRVHDPAARRGPDVDAGARRRAVRSVVPASQGRLHPQRVYTHARVAGSSSWRVMIGGDAAHLMRCAGPGVHSGSGRHQPRLELAMLADGQPTNPSWRATTTRSHHAAAMVKISRPPASCPPDQPLQRGVRDVITRAWDYVPPFKRYSSRCATSRCPPTQGIIVGAGCRARRPRSASCSSSRGETREGATPLLATCSDLVRARCVGP